MDVYRQIVYSQVVTNHAEVTTTGACLFFHTPACNCSQGQLSQAILRIEAAVLRALNYDRGPERWRVELAEAIERARIAAIQEKKRRAHENAIALASEQHGRQIDVLKTRRSRTLTRLRTARRRSASACRNWRKL